MTEEEVATRPEWVYLAKAVSYKPQERYDEGTLIFDEAIDLAVDALRPTLQKDGVEFLVAHDRNVTHLVNLNGYASFHSQFFTQHAKPVAEREEREDGGVTENMRGQMDSKGRTHMLDVNIVFLGYARRDRQS
jgi:hypothetical protein